MTDPSIARLRLYPIKALDGVEVEHAEITATGTLAGDRRYALHADGDVLNAKATEAVHRLKARYPEPPHVVALNDGDRTERFDLREERAAAERFCSDHFDRDVSIRERETGFVDRTNAGPSVISTATLRTVAGWYDALGTHELRRRLRANVEVEGVPAFWEDQFVGDGPDGFTAGDVRIEGVEACVRCLVPERDPDTGRHDPEFRERFLERRREALPAWIDENDLDSLYSLMLIASVPEADRGRTLSVGDTVPDPG